MGTLKEQAVLADCIREMGFNEEPCGLPKSLLMAISNRFTKDQVLKRNRNSAYYRPVFFTGSAMFPAYMFSRTPKRTLEDITNLMIPGTLRGYNRHAIRNHVYQALYPSGNPTDKVTGIVYFGIYKPLEGMYNYTKAVA